MAGHQIAELRDRTEIVHLAAVHRQRQRDVRMMRPNGRMEGPAAGNDAANTFQNDEIIESQVDGVRQRSQMRRNDDGFLELRWRDERGGEI